MSISTVTRRHFIRGLTAALAGCRQQGPEEKDLFHGLRQYIEDMRRDDPAHTYGFLDKDGKPITIDELEKSLQGSYKTVSFGFANCAAICPGVNNNLSRLDKLSKKKLVNVIISVQPEADGITEDSRAHFKSVLKDHYGLPENFIILYPAQDGIASAAAARGFPNPSTATDPKAIPKLSALLGAIPNMDTPVKHSGDVLLYGPDGRYITQANGMADADTFKDTFASALGYQTQTQHR